MSEPHETHPARPGACRARLCYRCPSPSGRRTFITDSYHTTPAVVMALSQGGAVLLLGKPVEVGTIVTVEWEGPDGEPLAALAGQVTGLTEAGGGWRCECALCEPLTEPEVRALLR